MATITDSTGQKSISSDFRIVHSTSNNGSNWSKYPMNSTFNTDQSKAVRDGYQLNVPNTQVQGQGKVSNRGQGKVPNQVQSHGQEKGQKQKQQPAIYTKNPDVAPKSIYLIGNIDEISGEIESNFKPVLPNYTKAVHNMLCSKNKETEFREKNPNETYTERIINDEYYKFVSESNPYYEKDIKLFVFFAKDSKFSLLF